MNSDEYLGGMSSDRPLKALVPGGSSVPFYQQFNL
jgi:NADH-quinone oxidoreductase subunit F